MKQTSEFTPAILAELRVKIQTQLDAIAQEYSLQGLKLGNMRYGPTEFNVSVNGTVKVENSPAAQAKLKQESALLGYGDNIVGEWFTFRGEKFQVTGLALNRQKYPIIAKNVGGKEFKFGGTVAHQFENKAITYNHDNNMFRKYEPHF